MATDLESRIGDWWNGLTLQILLSSAPYDLTSATAEMKLKKSVCASDNSLLFSTADSTITIDNPLLGTLVVIGQIINLEPADYPYSLRITPSNGHIFTPIEGTFTITPSI